MGQVLYYLGWGHNDDRLQLFPLDALWVSGKMTWQNVENTYKVLYFSSGDLAEYRQKFTEKEITGDSTDNPELVVVPNNP
jgi:hypothetical protein